MTQARHVLRVAHLLEDAATYAPVVGRAAAACRVRQHQILERAGRARRRAAAAARRHVARKRRAAHRRWIRRRADGGRGEETGIRGSDAFARRRAGRGWHPAGSGAAAGALRAATAPPPRRRVAAVGSRRFRRKRRAGRFAFAEEFFAGAFRAQESRQP